LDHVPSQDDFLMRTQAENREKNGIWPLKIWPLWQTQAIITFSWLLLALPWLSGIVTIPWDAKAHFHPQLQALATALHSGQSPFWTPYVFAGHPQVADPQSLIFSPLHLILAALNPAPSLAAGDAVLFTLLLFGMMSLVLFFKDRAWHPAGAVVAALAFGFGAAAAWRIQHVGQVMSLAYLAMALMLLSRMLAFSSKRYAIAFGTAAALMVLGRDQIALIGVYVLIAFVLTYWLTAKPRWQGIFASLLPLAISTCIIVILAGGPSLLTAMLAEESNRPSISLIEAGKGSLHPAAMLTAWVANLFGASGPLVNHWGPPSPTWGPVELYLARNMSVLYVGALPVLAMLWVGILQGQLLKAEIRFFTIVLILTLLYALGRYTPAFMLMFDYFPGISLFRRPADAVFILGLFASIAGGYCVHRLASERLQKPKLWQSALNALIVLAVLACAAWIAWSKGAFELAVLPLTIAAASLALALGVMIGLPLVRSRSSFIAVALVAATMTMDLAVSNGPSESTALPSQTYEVLTPASTNETIAILRRELARTASPDRRDRVELTGIGFHWPNASLVHGLDNTLGYNPLRLGLYSAATGAEDHVALPDQRRFSKLMPGYRSLLSDMLGLRFIATGAPIEQIDKSLKLGDLPLIFKTGDAWIYENSTALPRVMIATDAKQANFDTILKTGIWPDFDPRKTVLLDPAIMSANSPISTLRVTGQQRAPTARIVQYDTTRVMIETETSSPAYLILNDVWHRWWTVEVNGKSAANLRANVLFRSVLIPAGTSSITFRFSPIRGIIHDIFQHFRRQ
jgi:hypothetical protein